MSPDLTTEVIGFRQWRVDDELRLCPAAWNTEPWRPGVNVAECAREYCGNPACSTCPATHPAPATDCECGLYALHWPNSQWYGVDADIYASGVVSAWGNIEVHHEGFRAQFARVVALAEPASKRDRVIMRGAATEYGVPVVAADELVGIANEYGSPVPESMRPEPVVTSAEELINRRIANYYAASVWLQASLVPTVTKPNRKARRTPATFTSKAPTYNPRAFIPKRKGGLA